MDEFRYRAERDPDIFDESGVGLPSPVRCLALLIAAGACGGIIAWWLA